jgi:hypothetical protein
VTSTGQRLTGRISVGLPPAEAFLLFTPRGEQAWAHGWHPRFTGAGSHSEAEVTYQLTALTPAASHKLREFADGYAAYLRSWQDAITTGLQTTSPPPASHLGT